MSVRHFLFSVLLFAFKIFVLRQKSFVLFFANIQILNAGESSDIRDMKLAREGV